MTVFRKILVCSLLTCLVFAPPLLSKDKASLAVLSFKNKTGKPKLDKKQEAIAQDLRSELSTYTELSLPDSGTVDKLMEELKITKKYRVKKEKALALGKKARVQYVVYGEFTGRPGKLTITAHVAEVATGEVFDEIVIGNNRHNQLTMARILAYNIRHRLTEVGGLVKTYKIRNGWYPSMAILSGVSFLTSGIFYLMAHDAYENKYKEASMLDDIERYFSRAKQVDRASRTMIKAGTVLSTATLLLWLRCQAYSNYIYTGRSKEHSSEVNLWLPDNAVGAAYHLKF